MMKIKFPAPAILITILLIVSSTALAAPGAGILYEETYSGNGLWQYDYVFYNTSTAGESLFSVWFDFSQTVNVTGSLLPAGWDGTLWNGTHTTSWVNAFSTSPVYDITAGSHLAGFSFTLDQRAGDIPYTAYFDGEEGTVHTSDLIAIVPEPLSYLLFIAGWAFFVLRRYYTQRA